MIRLRTLGTCGLSDEAASDFSAVLRQPKRFALLAYLALARPRGFIRRDSVLALFWPELDTERARGSLRQSLYTLRRQLPEDVLVNRGDTEVGLNPDRFWCDVYALEEAVADERYEDAVELYAGELLPGFHVPDAAPDLGYWLDAERDRLRRMALDAAVAASAAAEARGELNTAIRFAGRAAGLAPLDEEGVRRQVELMHAAGDRTAAVRTLEHWMERYETELELTPSDSARELMEWLRTAPVPRVVRRSPMSDPTSRPPEPGTAAPAGRSAAPAVGPNPEPPRDPTDSPSAPRLTRSIGRTRGLRLALAVLAMAAISTAVLLSPLRLSWLDGNAATAGNRVMILPFSYHGGADGAYLSEGLVYLFSVALDGSEFRTVDPHALIRQATAGGPQEFDPASGSELAGQVDANYFVLGNAVAAGEELRLTATLYAADGGAALASVSVRGGMDGLIDLVDAATAELLTARSGGSSRVTRLAAVTTSSLPALKAYLSGERLMREGRFTDALAAFDAAVLADSIFALAHYRASAAASWAFRGDRADHAAARAVRHAERLPEHERRLLAAHEAYRQGRAAEAEEMLRELAIQYPDDSEVWYRLGEVILHSGALRGGVISDAREPFYRATQTEPTHPEAYYHLAQLSALGGDTAGAEELAQMAFDAAPEGARNPQLLTLLSALGRGQPWSARVRELGRADAFTVVSATYNVAVYAGRPDLARDVARLLVLPAHPTDTRLFGHLLLAELELALGRWSAARTHLEAMQELDAPLADHYGALLALAPAARMPDAGMEALLGRIRTGRSFAGTGAFSEWTPDGRYDPLPHLYARGMLASRLGRTAELEQVIQRMTAIGVDAALGAELANDLRLSGGLLAESIAPSFAAPAEVTILSPVLSRPGRRYRHGLWLAEQGQRREGRRVLESLSTYSVHDLPWAVPALLDRARLQEELGDRMAAAALYRRFIALWKDADDPALIDLAGTRLSAIETEYASSQ